MTSDASPIKGVYFSFIEANGLVHRLASPVRKLTTTGGSLGRSRGYPLILFLHGFPESWYSWRHQLIYLQDKPFLPVAPDMRGYGFTSQPRSLEDYTQPIIAKDVIEIAKVLGYDKFFVVGHDWGCLLAWSVCLLYPNSVTGVCGMSVPYAGTPKKGLLTMLEARYGKCVDSSLPRDILEKAKFHYMLHHCLPRCAEEYDKNIREFLYRIYGYQPGCKTEEGTPEHDVHGLMFPLTGNEEYDKSRLLNATAAPGLWHRMPRPESLPNWMSEEDLNYYIGEFERAGFHGGLCWYRAGDRNFQLMKDALRNEDGGYDDKIRPPALFLIGENDALVKFYGGKTQLVSRFKANAPNLTREPIFLKDCGHWIQQEQPEAVNEALIHFFADVLGRENSGRSKL